MLNTTNQKMKFNQFLFSHFNIQFEDSISEDVNAEELAVTPISKEDVARIVLAKKIVNDKENDLAEIINSLPQKKRSVSHSRLAHKHESEWYHTFRDLQDKIALDLSKEHSSQNGILKLKSEIKEFWEELDEVIEKGSLEIERIFQVFPNMSRVAVIYLLSLIIALPLVFFSSGQDTNVSSIEQSLNKQGVVAQKQIHISDEMKSSYIARNSDDILNSGKDLVQITRPVNTGRVAGAYEEKYSDQINNELKRKISAWYDLFEELKDEISFVISTKLSK